MINNSSIPRLPIMKYSELFKSRETEMRITARTACFPNTECMSLQWRCIDRRHLSLIWPVPRHCRLTLFLFLPPQFHGGGWIPNGERCYSTRPVGTHFLPDGVKSLHVHAVSVSRHWVSLRVFVYVCLSKIRYIEQHCFRGEEFQSCSKACTVMYSLLWDSTVCSLALCLNWQQLDCMYNSLITPHLKLTVKAAQRHTTSLTGIFYMLFLFLSFTFLYLSHLQASFLSLFCFPFL